MAWGSRAWGSKAGLAGLQKAYVEVRSQKLENTRQPGTQLGGSLQAMLG